MPATLTVLEGAAIEAALPAIARLRLTVFRDWPYLYAGSEAYERAYLQTYVTAPGAAVILAEDGPAPIGASTCLPLAEAAPEVRAPFAAQNLPLADYFYFGESVLLPAYRGAGLGVAFFAAREAVARRHGQAKYAAFCAVLRPPTHPLRPPDAPSLETFWTRRGFRKQESLVCRMRWQDIDQAEETEKSLVFWVKPL